MASNKGGFLGTLQRVFQAVTGLGEGKSLSQASKEANVSPNTVRRYNERRDLYQAIPKMKTDASGATRPVPRQVASYRVTRGDSWYVLTHEAGGPSILRRVRVDSATSSQLGHYWNDVKYALDHEWVGVLLAWQSTTIVTLDGQVLTLETDPNAIYQWWYSLSESQRATFDRNLYLAEGVA